MQYYLFLRNILIGLLSTTADLPEHKALFKEKYPAEKFAKNFCNTDSFTEPSPEKAKIIFCLSHFFKLIKIKNSYTRRVGCFYSFSNPSYIECKLNS